MYKITCFVQNDYFAIERVPGQRGVDAGPEALEEARRRNGQGQTVRILRHGKPVADLVPVRESAGDDALPNWKRPFAPVQLPPGVSLAQAVRDDEHPGEVAA